MNLTSLFNLKGLAIAFGLGLLIGGGGAYFAAVSQFERAALSAAPKAAAAQHQQDVKQHGQAVKASAEGDKQSAGSVKNTAAQVQVIHDTKTVFVNVPAQCPADPEMDPAVIGAYNKAGH